MDQEYRERTKKVHDMMIEDIEKKEKVKGIKDEFLEQVE